MTCFQFHLAIGNRQQPPSKEEAAILICHLTNCVRCCELISDLAEEAPPWLDDYWDTVMDCLLKVQGIAHQGRSA